MDSKQTCENRGVARNGAMRKVDWKRFIERIRDIVLLCLMAAIPLAIPCRASTEELPFPGDERFLGELAFEIVDAMEAFRPPISTFVLSVDDTGVFIKAGATDRALVGMRFQITPPGGGEETIIQLDRVEKDFSHGKILSGPMPDHMYGADYLPESAWVEYIVPSSEPNAKKDFFWGLASAVEASGGWSVASVGNDKWRYSTQTGQTPVLQTFKCRLSFKNDVMGTPTAFFILTAPGGEQLKGGLAYHGDWLPITAGTPGSVGWYEREANVGQDRYALETIDLDGDGKSEIILAGETSLSIYNCNGRYLELKYKNDFTPVAHAGPVEGDLGYLGILRISTGWRFYSRPPGVDSTSVCELVDGLFRNAQSIKGIPVANTRNGDRIILAQPLDSYHLFMPDGLQMISTSDTVRMSTPSAFTFMAIGNYDGAPGYETIYLDGDSKPHMLFGGGDIKTGFQFGAGVWSFDIDSDGQDEVVTSGRRISSDHLDFYKVENGELKLIDFSPSLDNRIIDAAFGDIDGDGNPEPLVLAGFGRDKRLIF